MRLYAVFLPWSHNSPSMNQDFTNSVILPESLPSIESVPFNPLERNYLKILYIRSSITSLILMGSPWFVWFLSEKKIPEIVTWVGSGFFLAIWIYSLFVAWRSFRYRGYAIRERDIAYQRGWIQYRLTSIPFNRIQHVELIQGILSRQMNLASIKIFTAGTSSDDLVIPGLPFETARQIREFLTGKISRDE